MVRPGPSHSGPGPAPPAAPGPAGGPGRPSTFDLPRPRLQVQCHGSLSLFLRAFKLSFNFSKLNASASFKTSSLIIT
jgi:hypothetical protein